MDPEQRELLRQAMDIQYRHKVYNEPNFLYLRSMGCYDMFQAFGKSLYDAYEERGFEVLHVLSYFNNGLDWFTGRRVKEDEHGFEVIYRFPRG